jgi:hypothetical protein
VLKIHYLLAGAVFSLVLWENSGISGTPAVPVAATSPSAQVANTALGKPSCDLNSDGVVNVLDVQIAVNQSIGAEPCGSADLNQDGVCNGEDVQRVANASLGQACRIGR